MAIDLGSVALAVTPDMKQFAPKMEKGVKDSMKRVGGSMQKVGAIATGLITAPIIAGFSKMTDAASDLGESINATNVVFGKASDKISAFADRAAKDAGLSKRAFNELVTPIGAMLQNVGFAADEAADSSINLAQRAADMASVFNVDVSEALGAIQAGLRGEADPLERFGVGLSDAAVTAHALEMGLAGTADELDANAKTQARLSLLMKQTDKIAGDFANTSDQVANAERIAAAEAENLAARFGQKLIPVKAKAIELASRLLDWFNDLSPAGETLAMSIAGVAAAGGPLLVVVGTAIKTLPAFGAAVTAAFGPVGIAAGVVAALAAGLVYAYKESETFRRIVDRVFSDVAEGFQRTVGWVGERLQGLGELFGITRKTVGQEVAAMSNEAVGEMVDMVSGMTDQAHALAHDGETLSAELADGWIANVHKMRDESIAAAQEQYEGVRQNAYNLAADLQSVTAVQAGEVIRNAEQQRDETVEAARQQAERVERQITILRDRGVAISEDQAARIVGAMENQRDGAVAALLGQSQQVETILAMLRAESGKITLGMAADTIRNSATQRDTTIAAANTEYQGRVAAILAMKNESTAFTQEMANAAILEARKMRDDSITAANAQHTGVVTEVKGMRTGVSTEVDLMTGDVISDFDRMNNRIIEWQVSTKATLVRFDTNLVNWRDNTREKIDQAKGYFSRLDAKITEWQASTKDMLDRFNTNLNNWQANTKEFVDKVVGFFQALPGRIGDALSGLGEKIKDAFTFDLPSITLPWNRGDGPGAPIGPGGRAMDRARQLAMGLPIAMTSGYRSPAHNARVGGSPTSYHMDANNPASDWVGPTWALDEFAARLRNSGGWRELLWRVPNHAPGDNPHVHVADQGGVFRGPGFVWMNEGYETFASGLSAEKVSAGGEGLVDINLALLIDGQAFARATGRYTREELRSLEVSLQ